MIPVARGFAVAMALAVGVAAGCGTSAAPGDGGGGSGGAGSGGSGGAPPACPAAAPSAGASCDRAQTCFYEDCGAAGRTVATCANGGWSLEAGPCTGVFCQSQTCAVGEICLMSGGGALLVECIQNTCGSGAITCGCLQSCTPSCSVSGSLQSGVTIRCNSCPSNQCA